MSTYSDKTNFYTCKFANLSQLHESSSHISLMACTINCRAPIHTTMNPESIEVWL